MELKIFYLLSERSVGRTIHEVYHEFVNLLIQMMKSAGVKQPEIEGRKLAALLDDISLHYMFDDEYPLDEMFDYLIDIYTERHVNK